MKHEDRGHLINGACLSASNLGGSSAHAQGRARSEVGSLLGPLIVNGLSSSAQSMLCLHFGSPELMFSTLRNVCCSLLTLCALSESVHDPGKDSAVV